MKKIDGGVTAARGFLAGAVRAGIKTEGVDLSIVHSELRCWAGATYTTNKVKAASLIMSKDHLADGRAQTIVVNSGNANACTGEGGYADAFEMAQLASRLTGSQPNDVVVASTGVVGVPLPMDKVRAAIPKVVLSRDGGHDAALGIMTTDLVSKEIAVEVEIGSSKYVIGGMAKGSGMIHPNMATMLAFLTSDANVEPRFLRRVVSAAVDRSFNMITVDGDTSVSDMVVVLTNGAARNPRIRAGSAEAEAFREAIEFVMVELAKAIARDGEGATKLLEVKVRGAGSARDARLAARSVAGSSLFKAAVHGADPNWGRILTAVGYSGAVVDQDRADVSIGGIALMEAGRILAFDRAAASEAMKSKDVSVMVDLHLGDHEAVAWGCDLTHEYVDINAHYTT